MKERDKGERTPLKKECEKDIIEIFSWHFGLNSTQLYQEPPCNGLQQYDNKSKIKYQSYQLLSKKDVK